MASHESSLIKGTACSLSGATTLRRWKEVGLPRDWCVSATRQHMVTALGAINRGATKAVGPNIPCGDLNEEDAKEMACAGKWAPLRENWGRRNWRSLPESCISSPAAWLLPSHSSSVMHESATLPQGCPVCFGEVDLQLATGLCKGWERLNCSMKELLTRPPRA